MDVQEAVTKAFNYVRVLYAGQDIQGLLLEEVEREAPGWRVTVSFFRPRVTNPVAQVLNPEYIREYKLIELSEAGELTALRIFKP